MKKILKRTISISVFSVAYIALSYSLIEMDRYVKKTYSCVLQNGLLKILVYFILSIGFFVVIKIWIDTAKKPVFALLAFCIITFLLGVSHMLLLFTPLIRIIVFFQPCSDLMITYSGAIAAYLVVKKILKTNQ